MREHEPLCPSQRWNKWWGAWFAVQDCQCRLIRQVQAAERERLIPEVLALPHSGYTEGAEVIWREDVLELLGVEDDDEDEDG